MFSKLMSKILNSPVAKELRDKWTYYHTLGYGASFTSVYTWYQLCYKEPEEDPDIKRVNEEIMQTQMMMRKAVKDLMDRDAMSAMRPKHFAPEDAKAKDTN